MKRRCSQRSVPGHGAIFMVFAAVISWFLLVTTGELEESFPSLFPSTESEAPQ